MSAPPLLAPLPADLDLDTGWVIEWGAVDPTSGATVANVTVSDATIEASNLSAPGTDLSFGPFMLVPGPSA